MKTRRPDGEAMLLANDVWNMTGNGAPPLNCELIAKVLGILVVRRILPPGIEAMSDLSRRIVVLDSRRSARRQRFSFCHEVAEILTLDLDLPHRHWQNEFAGHLLVPIEHLQSAMAKCKDLARLCAFFEAGESVVLYQMRFLNGLGSTS